MIKSMMATKLPIEFCVGSPPNSYPLYLRLSEFHLLPILFDKISKDPSKEELARPVSITLEEYVERARLPPDSGLAVLTRAAELVFKSQLIEKRSNMGFTQRSYVFAMQRMCKGPRKRAVEFELSTFAQEHYMKIKKAFSENFLEETSGFYDSESRLLYTNLRRSHSLQFCKKPGLVLEIKDYLEDFHYYFNSYAGEKTMREWLEKACQEINTAPFSVFSIDYRINEETGQLIFTVRLAIDKIIWQDLRIDPDLIYEI